MRCHPMSSLHAAGDASVIVMPADAPCGGGRRGSARRWIGVLAGLLAGCSSVAAQDFYPLAFGNSWYYRCVGGTGGDSLVCSSVDVVGDSLFANGHRYFVLDEPDIMESRFVRKDSDGVYYMNPYTGEDRKVFPLNGRVGDTVFVDWSPYMWVQLVAVDTFQLFGALRAVHSFVLDGLMFAQLRFCDGLGPITEWRYSDPAPPWPDYGRELVGCRIGGTAYGVTLGVAGPQERPRAFALLQNYPNPFNPSTAIAFTLAEAGPVRLSVYDQLGREAARLSDESLPAGTHTRSWSGANAPSGSYYYRLTAGRFGATRRMLLIK